jgi:hypothetical protein
VNIVHYPFPPVGEAPPVEREPYPAPVLTSDMPCTLAPFSTVADLADLARSYGWTAVITFAEGYVPHASYGTPGKTIKKSQAVRMVRGGTRAVAVRMGSSWDSMWIWSGTQFFTRYATLAEFEEALR